MGLTELTESNQEINTETEDKNPANNDKWRWAIYIGLIFLLVSNSYTYSITQNLLGSFTNITVAGVPSAAGIVIHCIIFVLLVRLLMNCKI